MVNGVNGTRTGSQRIDEETFARYDNPSLTHKTGLAQDSASAEEIKNRLEQAGVQSRTDVNAALLRDVLSSATSNARTAGPESAEAALTNGRFLGEPSLEGVLQGTALPRKSEGVKRVQQALMDMGFTVRGGADGIYGLASKTAVQQFQREQSLPVTGMVDATTLRMLDAVSPAAGEKAKLTNARFADDPKLQDILMGKRSLSRLDNGDTVKRVQQALKDLGYNAPIYGVDGALGGEAARIIKSFQKQQGLPVTGTVNRATLRELNRVATEPGQKLEKYPEYERMFTDGFLTTTMAVGFDEEGWGNIESNKLRNSLSSEGYRTMNTSNTTDKDLLSRAGYDATNLPAGVTYHHKTFNYQGRTIDSIVQFINQDTPEAAKRFEAGLVKSDMVMYMGHARYGTGPDFDTKESTAGNYVIGVNSQAHKDGKVKPGYDEHMNEILKDAPNSLEKTEFDKNRYQLMAFYACKTINYQDELRAIVKNKDEKNLDVVGSNELIYWHNMAASGMMTLRAVTSGESINSIEQRLYDIHQIENAFYTDGFGDNA